MTGITGECLEIGERCEYRDGSKWRTGVVQVVHGRFSLLDEGGLKVGAYDVATAERGGVTICNLKAEHVRRARYKSAKDPERLARKAAKRAAPKARKPAPERGEARSAEYLGFVRSKNCFVCGKPGPNDAHHYGSRGMGQKTSDFRTVPLCREDHRYFHDHGALRNFATPAEVKEAFYKVQVELLIVFFTQQASGAHLP